MAFVAKILSTFGFSGPTGNKPDAPQDLVASKVGDTYFTVSWGLSAGATRFLVYLGGTPVGYTTKTTMQFTRKLAGQVYSVTVSGINNFGEGPQSTPLLVGTNAATSKGLKTPVRIPRSKLRQYTDGFVTNADEQEMIADGAKTWVDGLTATLYHWKLDLVNSVKDELFDEWSTQIYGDPLAVKGRIDVTPSEDLMAIIGTGRNFDGVITVHKLPFETREIAPTDLFSFKGQFYKLSAISSNELFREQETFLYFTAFKRNTPELDAGVNQSVLT